MNSIIIDFLVQMGIKLLSNLIISKTRDLNALFVMNKVLNL